MKRILFILASWLLLCNLPLYAQRQELEFYLYNSNKLQLLESYIQHQSQPLKNTFMRITGQSSWDSRLNFNQEIRKSLVACVLGYQGQKLSHNLSLDYESYLDENDLDPTPYNNKNGRIGYSFYYYPIDSLSVSGEMKALMRNEQDRYSPGNILRSDGYQYQANLSYHQQMSSLFGQLQANLQKRDLNWEKYHSEYARLNLVWDTQYINADASASYTQRQDEIFNLLINSTKRQTSYQKLDTQKRSYWDLYSTTILYPTHNIDLMLRHSYNESDSKMLLNNKRNSAENINNLQLDLNYRLSPGITYRFKAQHNYNIKDFSYLSHIRHQDLRGMSTGLVWEYNPFDSVSVNLGIDLLRSSFPKYFHRWDNDLRSRSMSLNWKHYYKENLRLNSRLMYQQIEDYYIDAMLSGNNHQIRSLSLNPEMELLISDRLSFRQNYQIRTDYSDYVFPEMNTDKLYRQLGYGYTLIYDNFPYVIRAGDGRWFYHSYRQNPGSIFMGELNFSYEENQYADKEGDYYLLHTKNRRYQLSLFLQHSIGALRYRIRPQYLWGTWKEYSIRSGIVWDLTEDSYLELTYSPVWEEYKPRESNSSLHLNMRF